MSIVEAEWLNNQSNLKENSPINFIDLIALATTALSNDEGSPLTIWLNNLEEFKEIEVFNEGFYDFPILKSIINNFSNPKPLDSIHRNLILRITENLEFHSLSKAYSILNFIPFKSHSIKDLIVEYYNKRSEHTIDIHLELTDDAFAKMETVLQQAKLYYNADESPNNNPKYKNLESVNCETLIEEINKLIFSIENSLVEIRESKQIFINEQINIYNQEFENHFNVFQGLKSDFQIHLMSFGNSTPNKPGLLNFSSKEAEGYKSFLNLKSNLETYFNLKYKSINLEKLNISSLEDIEKFLNMVDLEFENWNHLTLDVIFKNLKRLNPFHSLKSFKETLEEIKNNYNDINSLNLFKSEFSLNSQNLSLIIANVMQTLSDLKQCRNYIGEYNKHRVWINFYKELEPSQKNQIEELLNFEKNKWNHIFESNFIRTIIEKNINPILFKLPQHKLSNLNDIKKNELQILSYYYSKILHLNLKNYLKEKNLKSEKLEKEIASENITLLSIHQILSPLIIKQDKTLDDSDFKILSGNNKVEITLRKNNFDLILEDLKKIELIPIADRFQIASKIANVILYYNDQFQVFQTKNSNIISLLPKLINEKIALKLNDKGVKEIRVQDNKKNLIVESILIENKKSILVISDNLLNSNMFQDYYYQMEIITALKTIGFSILNLYSLELFRKGEIAIDSLLKDVD